MKAELALSVVSFSMCVVLSGCMTLAPEVSEPGGQPAEDLPAAAVTDEEDGGPKLKPGLAVRVEVVVQGKREILEDKKQVADSGEIALPLIGGVKVDGMTLPELSDHLAKLYDEYFVEPQVVVEFSQGGSGINVSPWGYVTVLGRVKKPGRVSIPPTRDMTLSGAVLKAGGFDTSAKTRAIRLTRRKPDGTVEHSKVDLRSVGAKGEMENDVVVQPGDVVFVPESIF